MKPQIRLNTREAKVLQAIVDAGGPISIRDAAKAAFPGVTPIAKADSWVRNSVRRPTIVGWIRRVGDGLKPGRYKVDGRSIEKIKAAIADPRELRKPKETKAKAAKAKAAKPKAAKAAKPKVAKAAKPKAAKAAKPKVAKAAKAAKPKVAKAANLPSEIFDTGNGGNPAPVETVDFSPVPNLPNLTSEVPAAT